MSQVSMIHLHFLILFMFSRFVDEVHYQYRRQLLNLCSVLSSFTLKRWKTHFAKTGNNNHGSNSVTLTRTVPTWLCCSCLVINHTGVMLRPWWLRGRAQPLSAPW